MVNGICQASSMTLDRVFCGGTRSRQQVDVLTDMEKKKLLNNYNNYRSISRYNREKYAIF